MLILIQYSNRKSLLTKIDRNWGKNIVVPFVTLFGGADQVDVGKSLVADRVLVAETSQERRFHKIVSLQPPLKIVGSLFDWQDQRLPRLKNPIKCFHHLMNELFNWRIPSRSQSCGMMKRKRGGISASSIKLAKWAYLFHGKKHNRKAAGSWWKPAKGRLLRLPPYSRIQWRLSESLWK